MSKNVESCDNILRSLGANIKVFIDITSLSKLGLKCNKVR